MHLKLIRLIELRNRKGCINVLAFIMTGKQVQHYIIIAALGITCFSPLYAQLLYEEFIPTGNPSTVQTTTDTNETAPPTKDVVEPALAIPPNPINEEPLSMSLPRWGINFASIIFSGDIQVNYETPMNNEVSWIATMHWNPHVSHQDETGKWGGMGGARWYMDPNDQKGYGQVQVGMNMSDTDTFHLIVDLGVGYVIPWRSNVWMAFGAGLQRMYVSTQDDVKLYALASFHMSL